MHCKHIATLILALAAATTGSLAQARDAHVQWAVTIGSPVAYSPLPPPPPLPFLLVQQRPTMVVAPAPVVQYRPAPVRHGWRDSDRDGIPNRYDRMDNRRAPAWDRDGDGIPNRYDRRDHRDHRRDGWHGR